MIQHKYELYVGRVIGVHEDYVELLFCLKGRSYTLKYGGNSLYASVCKHFRIFKRTYLRLFSNLRF